MTKRKEITMKKRITALLILVLILGTAACSSKNTLSGVYTPDRHSCGYSFNSDGTVIYYKTNWEKVPLGKSGCIPTYAYGTYTVDEKALTIKLSGYDSEITGVIMSSDLIVIDGASCQKLTEPYSEYGEDESWAELGKAIGLE